MLVSIITPCLNRRAFVAEAIDSVRQQDYPYVEHIIMDGGSTDGTLEILARYPHLRVYSESDEGLYDAINKGIRLACGEVIGILNTDDMYEPYIFGSVVQAFTQSPQIDAVVGGATIFRDNGANSRDTYATFPCIDEKELLERLTQGAPIFNAWFFRKRLFEQLGVFDANYLYVADRDFLIRLALAAKSHVGLDRPFYRYRMHPGSYTLSGEESGEADFMFESRALAERYIHCKRLSSNALKCFRTWHSQIITEQIVTAWRRKAACAIVRYFFIGLHHNCWGWPKIFMKKVIERLPYILRHKSPGQTGVSL